jgi:rRNA maturation RNase YbeY
MVKFHFNYSLSLNKRKELKQFIADIFKKEKTLVSSIDIVFCDDEFLLNINRKFLNHDFYTDIITFNLEEGLKPVVGEIYISVDRVYDNASFFGCSLKLELHRVIFHGILHLCGYKDTSVREKKVMKGKEDFYLKKYFVPRET